MKQELNLEKIVRQVVEVSGLVSIYLKEEIGLLKRESIETKGIHNFVTYVDRTSEEKIVAALNLILPQAGIIAEEMGDVKRQKRYNWVIDPLDGTTNYIHGLPLYSISIALLDYDEVILGVVHEVNLNECFYAWKGSPAFLNGNRIMVSQSQKLNDSLIATGFPYHDYSMMELYLKAFGHLMRVSHGLRRLGSAAVDLAYVACGRFDGFYEYGLNLWDVAAGQLIVKQAGGEISDFKGGKNYLLGKKMVATNKLIHRELVNIIKDYFND